MTNPGNCIKSLIALQSVHHTYTALIIEQPVIITCDHTSVKLAVALQQLLLLLYCWQKQLLLLLAIAVATAPLTAVMLTVGTTKTFLKLSEICITATALVITCNHAVILLQS